MELPDPKVWAIYYKQIVNPQCFDVIFVNGLCWPFITPF